ncbi:hypothetical protein CC78DRAFT_530121 [Lojkania enalia]|uniref:Uncharacterized protein n=1 Tax=Lojkania enalia TaxID=147567 RepID=A0A9P4KHD9_9PLEO|nr:hypothetical protein CC78DRAFT_530121 [Didymosphaeria enalia]
MPPRRFQALFAFIFLLILTLFLFGPPSADTYEEVKDAIKKPQLPDHIPGIQELQEGIPRPFGPPAHKPPVQPNSTVSSPYHGAIEWLSDFKWHNPFSNAIALDENRAVLPPLKDRPVIYTFYGSRGKQDKAVSEAENRLILAWRRAWWAQGFKPQVLSRAEAMRHPQYQRVQQLKLDPKMELEMMRWLAWGHMGDGILANWLALPMARYDNPMLSFLRRKEYPVLSRVDTLQNAVFFGEGAAVNAAIKKAIDNPLFKNMTANKDKITALGKKPGGTIVNLLSDADIKVDSKANGIAYYSTETIANHYKLLAEKLTGNTTQVEGLDLLATLINGHLHMTFQNTFTDGIAVVKPLPEHTTALMYEAIDIARNLTQCPTTPLPESCPPNLSKCPKCDPEKPLKLRLLPSYKNITNLYSIGTVPHPYTINLLHYTRDTIDETWLRREAKRNIWITAVTAALLEGDHTDERRVLSFKDIVATPMSASNSLWLTAERESQVDLDWIFGFNLPQLASNSKKAEGIPITVFPRPGVPDPLEGVEVPDEKWIEKEEDRLNKAREAIKSEDRRMKEVVDAVEKWNIFDTEAWKFARAWSARRRVERRKWEEEEESFAGAERKSGLGWGSRWSDRR